MAATSAFAELLGSSLVNASGQVSTAEVLAGKEAVALYFSAHWCPPCRSFTPQLAQWYTANLQAKGLEVVFISSDRDEGQFKEYFGEMPWLSLPYEARELKNTLSEKYGVQGIPTLVILDADGNTITTDGRRAVSEDPSGQSFPWKNTQAEGGRAEADGGRAEAEGGRAEAAGGRAMKRGVTTQLMENQAKSGMCTCMCLPVCCFWLPLLFFMGAANTLSTCESDDFTTWMKIYGIVPLSSAMVFQFVATFWASRGSSEHFKNALRLQGLTSLVMFALLIWGWVEYMKTSEVMCVGEGGVNPRKLAVAFLILGSIGAPCTFCVAMKKIRNPTASTEVMTA